jgi:hypothetical protein
VLFTGDSKRWSDRSKIWKEGWRHLHQAHPAEIEAELLLEGHSDVEGAIGPSKHIHEPHSTTMASSLGGIKPGFDESRVRSGCENCPSTRSLWPLAQGIRPVRWSAMSELAVRRKAARTVSRMVEAAGVGLRKTPSCQYLARIRLAQARENRSTRQVEVQIRYTRSPRVAAAQCRRAGPLCAITNIRSRRLTCIRYRS